MPIGEIILGATKEVAKQAAKEVAKQAAKEILIEGKEIAKARMLDKPLNFSNFKEMSSKENNSLNSIKERDKPLNSKETGKVEKMGRMEPPAEIKFKCPEGMDRNEFRRQLKGQERGLNSQTVEQNMKNRETFERRKLETGNGRDLETSKKAQEIARQKAEQKRIESNRKNGMSYSEAKKEAGEWIKTKAALHNPDQIAGGDPSKVSRIGDARVNSSIGGQWRNNVDTLKDSVDNFAQNKSQDELARTKMNVKLVME